MEFQKETNLDAVKSTAIAFLYMPLHETDLGPMFIQHPFLDSAITIKRDGEKVELINYFENEDALQETLSKIKGMILESEDLFAVWRLILTKYHLTFLKYIKGCLSKKDFSILLSDAWVSSENPNQDANVTVKTAAAWFRQADKRYLMTQNEFEVWQKLPEKFQIYRGVAVGRNPGGLSWTKNLETAEWFAHRFDTKDKSGYMQTATVERKHVFAYFNGRGEDELVADVSKLFIRKI